MIRIIGSGIVDMIYNVAIIESIRRRSLSKYLDRYDFFETHSRTVSHAAVLTTDPERIEWEGEGRRVRYIIDEEHHITREQAISVVRS